MASEIGFARQGPSHASDGVLDAALLPGAVGIAEEGLDAEVGFEAVVLGELGAVVEGDGLAQLGWQGLEPGDELARGGFGSFVWLSGEDEDTGHALVGDQDGLAIGFEEHEVGFPMSGKARSLAASGRSAMETRPWMKLAGDPPLRPRQPRLALALGR